MHAVDAGLDHQHFEYIDAAGQADYRPVPILGLFAGYRYTLYDLHLHDPTGSNTAASFLVHPERTVRGGSLLEF